MMVADDGYFAHRDLPDGRHLCVMSLTFDRARLIVSDDAAHTWYRDGW